MPVHISHALDDAVDETATSNTGHNKVGLAWKLPGWLMYDGWMTFPKNCDEW